MKKYILVLCFVFVNIWAFAQDTDPIKDLENAIGGEPLTYKSHEENEGGYYVRDMLNFYALFTDDVVDYFQLNDKYKSELQKSVFKKTNEYQVLLDSINKLKLCRWKVCLQFYYHGNKREYDLKKSGFNIITSRNISNFKFNGYGESGIPCPEQSINLYDQHLIRLKQLSFTKWNSYKNFIGKYPQLTYAYTEYFILPIPPEEAVKMEEDKENIELYFVFNATGYKNVIFKYADDAPRSMDKTFKFGDYSRSVIETSKLRIIVLNKKTQYVYYDKIY